MDGATLLLPHVPYWLGHGNLYLFTLHNFTMHINCLDSTLTKPDVVLNYR